MFMNKIRVKDYIVAAAAAAFAFYAVYKGLQIVAICSMLAAGVVVYKYYAQRTVSLILDRFLKTSHTKIGKFELTVESGKSDLLPLMKGQPPWAQSIISQMKPEHIGMLITVANTNRYTPLQSQKEPLRFLRQHALIHHDHGTMAASEEVWLTELGMSLASSLMAPNRIRVEQVKKIETTEAE